MGYLNDETQSRFLERQDHSFVSNWTRRQCLRFGLGFALSVVAFSLSSCVEQNLSAMINPAKQTRATGRLQSRPTQLTEAGMSGLHPLQLDSRRDGWLYVPTTYQANHPAPLLLMLHGAGGDAEGGLRIVQPLADAFNTLVLAVDSRQQTWDVLISHYGPDIAFLDRALDQTFTRYAINPNQIAIAGFSDGASYALSVGLTNGDLFTHIIAFSPGFMAPAQQVGKPRSFISHGTDDTVLPIARCSRQLVPRLQQANYDVLYREFNGGHTVPSAIAQAAFEWFIRG